MIVPRVPRIAFFSLFSIVLCLGCGRPGAGGEGSGNGGRTGGDASGGTTSAGGSGGSKGGSGGSSAAGGSSATGGRSASGGNAGSGGTTSSGGAVSGGTQTAGGTQGAGGVKGTGGGRATGGATGTGAAGATGGTTASIGDGGAGGSDCPITVSSKSVSSKMATVGIVEWSTTIPSPSKAEVVYTLDNAGSSVLNVGGRAPVDLTAKSYRTLLLGLKPSSSYTFHIEVTSSNGTCKSADSSITTGTLSGVPKLTRNASKPTAQAKGFIIACMGIVGVGGSSGGTQAFIIDADGTVVWVATSPASCSRARMDYEGVNMWMMALNVMNSGGEMRYISMDGQTSQNNVSGLSKSHHDFTVLKGGVIATMLWSASGSDPESDLVERDAKGTVTTVFRIGSKVYAGGQSVLGTGSNAYHSNAILYHESDSTYTIGDRNPNLFVKVSRSGQPQWQFGGNCTGAPAPKCASGSWTSNHGHHLLDDGHFLFFNNGTFNSSSTPSQALEYTLNTSGATMSATQVKAYKSSSNDHSDSLGDVQRLPNGNTLVTFSNKGLIQELDPSWSVVQTVSASTFGYAEWRETMYGPPER